VGLMLFFCAAAIAATPEDEIMKADRDFNKATQGKASGGKAFLFRFGRCCSS
jgi:hypothetical protein